MSWQVITKGLLVACVKEAGKTLANEVGQLVAERIEKDKRFQKMHDDLVAGRGFEAASNVLALFPQKTPKEKRLN
jgi:hypothetical protein